MKTTVEIHGEGQVHVSLDPYCGGGVRTPPSAWNGARCELLIVDCIDWDKDTRQEGDAIYIEGRADAIRQMLTDALRLLDLNEQVHRERQERIFQRTIQCPRCGAYGDALNEWHGDGHGRACYGLADQRLALVARALEDAPALQAASDARHEAGAASQAGASRPQE